MKVLMIDGSPRKDGNTATALAEMEKVFVQEGVEVEIVKVGNQPVQGCMACGACAKLGRCMVDDVVNELAPKFEAADGLVVASPVYYANANAAAAALPPLTNSTNTSPSPACRWHPANIGTAPTAVCPAKPRKTWKACKPCVCLHAT